MSSKVRICHTESFPYFLSLSENGKFTGKSKNLVDVVLNIFQTGTPNVTFDFKPNQGLGSRVSLDSEQFTGCLGRLQRNQSDLLFGFANYPLDVYNVSQGLIVTDSQINFLPLYYYKDQITQQIDESFKSLSLFTWILTLSTLICMWLLLNLRCKLIHNIRQEMRIHVGRSHFLRQMYKVKCPSIRDSQYNFYRVASHFSKVGRISDSSIFHRILFIHLSVMSLVILLLFATLIKTELIVIPDPDLYKSYEDMMKANVSPLFYHGFNDEMYFTQAHPSTPEYKFWSYAKGKHPDINQMMIYTGTSNISSYLDDVLERMRVVFIDRMMAPLFQKIFCRFQIKDPKDFIDFLKNFKLRALQNKTDATIPSYNVMNIRNPTSSKVLKSAILSSHMKHDMHLLLRSVLRSVFEKGLVFALEVLAFDYDPLDDIFGKDNVTKMNRFRQCINNFIIKEEPDHKPLTYSLMRDFIGHCICLLVLSFFILLAEILRPKLFRRKKVKKQISRDRRRTSQRVTFTRNLNLVCPSD